MGMAAFARNAAGFLHGQSGGVQGRIYPHTAVAPRGPAAPEPAAGL